MNCSIHPSHKIACALKLHLRIEILLNIRSTDWSDCAIPATWIFTQTCNKNTNCARFPQNSHSTNKIITIFFIHIQLIYFCHDLAMKWDSDYHHCRLLELGMNCCWICRWIFVKNLFMKISIILSNNSVSAWESTFQYLSRLMGI